MMTSVEMTAISKRANLIAQLEITGAGKNLDGLLQDDAAMYGPSHVLVRKFRNKAVTFEILPKWIAELTVGNIPIEEPGVASARLYDRVPEDAPAHIRREWAYKIMVILSRHAPLLIAA